MRCYRIRASDLGVVEKKGDVWVKSSVRFDEAVAVAKLFLKHGNLGLIRDGDFLVGEICNGNVRGKRVDVLPDGTKLSKAFSLFAKNLRVHDERSCSHWDVLFENPSGSLTYVYGLDKVGISKAKKFARVDDFERCLPRLRKNLMGAIGSDDLVLAMLVLLKTKMRVGSEVYYKKNHHKGLTTLKKKDLKIVGDKVRFDFVGKDGVPQVLEERFSGKIVAELEKILKKKKKEDFVFLNEKGGILRDTDFEFGFEKFCGIRFYPHIVRSHFATREVERFLRKCEVGSVKSEVARKFCLELAGKLGHKKFSKKKIEWEENFEVTLHYYVRPDLVERIRKLV